MNMDQQHQILVEKAKNGPLGEMDWKAAGYTGMMAEALEDLEMDPREWVLKSRTEQLDAIMSWHGMQGYAADVIEWLQVIDKKKGIPG